MEKLNKKQKENFKGTPPFPDKIYDLLPEELMKLLVFFKPLGKQQDILLFSIIHILSGCLPNIYGYYFGKKVRPNLYGIVGGPPASGKNVMLLAKSLGDKIHVAYNEMFIKKTKDYAESLLEWKINKIGLAPIKPHLQLLYIPANTSAAGIMQLLSKLTRGIIADSEVDTLRLVFDQKFGDFSDVLRKVYHHEPANSYRKTNEDYLTFENGCLSLLLTGTAEQLSGLIKSAENGLFSRLCFYVYDSPPEFSNPFLKEYRNIAGTFDEYADELKRVHFELLEGSEKEFKFTEAQELQFNKKFPPHLEDFYIMTGSEGVSIVMRLGIIFFRIAMILTVVRNRKEDVLICDDKEFEAANLIVSVLTAHSLAVYSTLPDNETSDTASVASDILAILPEQFETKLIAEQLMEKKGISRRGTFRIISQLVNEGSLEKIKLGSYRKINNQK